MLSVRGEMAALICPRLAFAVWRGTKMVVIGGVRTLIDAVWG